MSRARRTPRASAGIGSPQLAYANGGANALAVQYAYDNLRRVTTITENGGYRLAGFAYDALGRQTALGSSPGGALAGSAYGYDGLDRLNQLTQTVATGANIVTLGITPTGSTSYAASSLNQYSAVARTGYRYDDGRGNLTSDGLRAFTYDLDNHLLTASAPTPVSLAYDPLGRLQTTTATGATTNFLYASDALVAEYDNSGNILRRYVPGPGQDEPLVWYEGAGNSSRRWLHADDLGSFAVGYLVVTHDTVGPAAGRVRVTGNRGELTGYDVRSDRAPTTFLTAILRRPSPPTPDSNGLPVSLSVTAYPGCP